MAKVSGVTSDRPADDPDRGTPPARPEAGKKPRFYDERVAAARAEVEGILARAGVRTADLFPGFRKARRPARGPAGVPAHAARPCGCGPARFGDPGPLDDDPRPSFDDMCDGPEGGVFYCGPDGPAVLTPPATGGPWAFVWDNTTNSNRWMDLSA